MVEIQLHRVIRGIDGKRIGTECITSEVITVDSLAQFFRTHERYACATGQHETVFILDC
jgi:hypothetical protein